ncbi:phosphopantetheine binding protein [Kitasatospora sp. SolWspMP-SS2h]|uniref:type I polyketide synthase n=1 Tax=Kitasatospora sp. SolWspMP-SS2h TaxID=1305729 RepID=UPI000DBA2423|nr:beta-ketoacyl synthase N-terminal-like domain-containing protein [Kitasatospora sp. SolWspMP-SS2h]RAJ43056.1 phosphopantetheine binding protein [Kitasatospora sp. SolWspMP-SS2h]
MSDRVHDDVTAPREDDGSFVAVIGMACRYPGAADPEEFWQNLVRGLDSVTRFPPRPVPGPAGPAGAAEYVPARGLLEDPEWFDAAYFGFSPRESRVISPQHRVFLECAVEALEDAGCDPERFPGAIGVYAGSTDTSYAEVVRSRREELGPLTDMEILVGNAPDYLASRVAYKIGLRGPAVVVQAACATSLVAVHTAAQALLAGDCDVALAGGAAVRVPAKESPYVEGGILSRDGTCRTFDAGAAGTVGGDGAGIVVLKRLSDALAHGDTVRAVLRGSAVNNDGAHRIGFTAPSVEGQAAVIRDAQLIAGVDAATIGYVEAHGTATPLGDPIEIAALTRAFRQDTDRRGFCRIGSVKTNIGHTDAAAGAAGLIKAVLALQHGVIPASLNFTVPNPRIDFAASPFVVAADTQEWRADEGVPRRAGVSSFGIGGTNAHLLLEQAPAPAPADPAQPWHLLVLSARTPTALDAATDRLAARLRSPGRESPVADIAWTLQTGRREHAWRRCAVVRDADDALRVLTGLAPGRLVDSGGQDPARPVALFFPGSVDSSRTRDLHATQPVFVRAYQECLSAADAGHVRADVDVLATELALARLWQSWGLRAAAVAGSGTGAVVADVVAGVCTVREAVRRTVTGAVAEPRTPGLPVLTRMPGPGEATDHLWMPVLPEGGRQDALPALLEAAGRLWLAGTAVRWEGLHAGAKRRRVPLPSYPFERQRYVVEPLPGGVPATAAADPPGGTAVGGPSDRAEDSVPRTVADLFAETLGLEAVEPDESFFDLGGDSLVAVQLLGRVREFFPAAARLDAAVLYEAQTPAELAALITGQTVPAP